MSDKMSTSDRIAAFLVERKSLVIVSLALAVLVIVAAVIWSPIKQNSLDKTAMLAEDIDEAYSLWLYADEESKEGKEEELLALFDSALDSKGATYAGQRALFMRGQYYISREMWEEASADYLALAEKFPQSYLTPTALFNAASTQEEAGNVSRASELYARLVDEFSETAPEAAEALFNLARLAESDGDKAGATEYYERIIADYGTSDWKNIAKTRILLMD